MSTISQELVDELLSAGPPLPRPARSPKQSKAHRRREARLRAALCSRVLRQHGYRHAVPLVEAIAEFTAISDKLPWPSQQVLAKLCGVTDRTIRHWLVVCERLGVLQVFRSKPHVKDGGWTRKTNRYLLCDRRAGAQPLATPLRRRQNNPYRKPVSSNASVFEREGVATTGDDPPSSNSNKFVKNKTCSTSPHIPNLPVSPAPPAIERNSVAVSEARKLARELLAATRR